MSLQSRRWARGAALASLVAAFGVLYSSVFVDLAGIWFGDDNYSHGPLLLPVIGYVIWARRRKLADQPLSPTRVGLAVLLASLALLLLGTAGVEFFLMRASAIGAIAGIILFLAGWGWLRLLSFPLFLTALLIPIPPVLWNNVTFPLQLIATQLGVVALQALSIPVLREGNLITLTHTTLEVTEACSGIRSLVSLFTLAVLYAHFSDGRPGRVAAMAVSSVPIAILANGFRIAGTGIAAQYFGAAAATGFTHSFSGWVVFITSVGLLMLVGKALDALGRVVAVRQPECALS
jgi:exosortase